MIIRCTQRQSRRGGQGIMEYLLLIAAVIAFLVFFMGKGGIFQKSYDNVIQAQGQDMVDMANAIFF